MAAGCEERSDRPRHMALDHMPARRASRHMPEMLRSVGVAVCDDSHITRQTAASLFETSSLLVSCLAVSTGKHNSRRYRANVGAPRFGIACVVTAVSGFERALCGSLRRKVPILASVPTVQRGQTWLAAAASHSIRPRSICPPARHEASRRRPCAAAPALMPCVWF